MSKSDSESDFVTFEPILKPKKEEHESFENELPALLRPKRVEMFVNEDDTKQVMTQVFIAVGLMIAAMFLAFVLSWAYNTEKTLFIAIFASITLLFSALIITLVSIIRNKIDDVKIFYVLVGSTAFMSIFSIVMIIVFSVIASKRLRRGMAMNAVSDYPA